MEHSHREKGPSCLAPNGIAAPQFVVEHLSVLLPVMASETAWPMWVSAGSAGESEQSTNLYLRTEGSSRTEFSLAVRSQARRKELTIGLIKHESSYSVEDTGF